MFFLMTSAPCTTTFASGVLQLKGEVVAFDSQEVSILVRKKQIYIIKRAALAPSQSEKISRAGDRVALSVPMEAVKAVKNVKTTKL